jgi:ribonuclease HI
MLIVFLRGETMPHLQLFTDASVNTQVKVGYGAYLVVNEECKPIETFKDKVKIKRFEQTSSTKLELQTLLWALDEIIILDEQSDITITIYSDSQNIIGLPGRRSGLERNDYCSVKNKKLKNHELYQEFYRLISSIKCELVKVAGHQKSGNKDDINRLFSLVDKASRRALREEF